MKIAGRVLTPKKLFLLVYDVVTPFIVLVLSYFALNNFQIPQTGTMTELLYKLPVVVVVSFVVFYLSGFYSQMWLYASILQYLIVPTGILIQTGVLTAIQWLVFRDPISWPWLWLYYTGTVFALIAVRVFYRLHFNRNVGVRQRQRRNPGAKVVRVMIIGAGRAGSRLAEDLREIGGSRYPVVFIDDNPKTHSYKHMNIPVAGGRTDIVKMAEAYQVDEIILAIPSLPSNEIKEIVGICQKTKCRIRILPSVTTLTEDEVGIKNVKDIAIEDLLGREPVKIDNKIIREIIEGKVVMVTGGGGSIGSELCRQIVKYDPKQLIVFDIYENNAYDLQQELISHYGNSLNLKVLIGSVREKKRLEEVFEQYRPQVIYHAAAHKHVPLMEDSPQEAIKNNVYGTYNVVKTAGKFGAERFVLISTDKAVNPTSVMGASKRLAEMTVLSVSKNYPTLKCGMVRFGNVLGSNGSVVPLFKRQIENERRVTVTDPEMRRYFMTIPEAVSLVLQASVFSNRGEIFVLDMGEPVKINDLAEAMIRLSGYEPNVDVTIEYCGLRPGEKMFEELYFDQETLDKTAHEKIMKLKQIEDTSILSAEIDHLFDMFKHEYPDIKEGILKRLTKVD